METKAYPEKKIRRTRSSRSKTSDRKNSVQLKSEALREVSDTISSRYYPVSLPTQLFLLNVDPHCLHATWNIRPEDIPLAKVPKSDILILKLYQQQSGISRMEEGGILVDEIQVNGFENAHYIYSLKGAGIYHAEIGILHKNRFISIIRSNQIHVPPPKIRQDQRPSIKWINHPVPAPRQLTLDQARLEAAKTVISSTNDQTTVQPPHSIVFSPADALTAPDNIASDIIMHGNEQNISTDSEHSLPASHIRQWSVSPITKRPF